MTPEIERMAREAGITICPNWGTVLADVHRLAKFAALCAEECAKECDTLADGPEVTPSQQFALDLASDAIRAKFAPSGGDVK